MPKTHDIAIVGLGAMGSAAACHLATRGRQVIGFDLSSPPHTLGSTHGESRIIREAYFEHPLYVPLVQRSYECWYDLQDRAGRDLLAQTGGLLMGPKEGLLVAGTRLSADRFGLDYDLLTPEEIRKRYPVFKPRETTVGVFEPRAGLLLPEECVMAHLEVATENGADLHVTESVNEWRPDGDGVYLKTSLDEYRVSRLVLTPGAWLGHFVPNLELPLSVERQVLYWFEPGESPEAFGIDRLPIFAWEYAPQALFYGFPNLGRGVKVALHHQGIVTDPETIDRSVSLEETLGMQQLLETTMPSLSGNPIRTEVCMYTNTPDEHFLIDFHPELPQVLIVSCCSGHGFKFAAVIGEIIADLLTTGESAFDLSPFAMTRLVEKD